MEESTKKTLEIETPLGTLVAYLNDLDPDNPGICIDLKKPGIDYTLNLAVVEASTDEIDGSTRLVTHVWSDGMQEDTTYDITHRRFNQYFEQEG